MKSHLHPYSLAAACGLLIGLNLAISVSVHAAPSAPVTGGTSSNIIVTLPIAADTNILAILQQNTNGLNMPLNTNDITVAPLPKNNNNPFNITLQVPKTEKPYHATLTLFEQNTQHPSLLSKQALITLPLTIYPQEDPASTGRSINQKQQENNIRLVISGNDPRLQSFLSARKINYDTIDSIPANPESGALYLGAITGHELKKLPNSAAAARLLLIVGDAGLPPGIYTTLTASGGAITKVTLPILNDLETNPRNREIFLNLLNQHLSQTMTVEN